MLAVAGCGEGGGEPLTHGQLVGRANAICAVPALDLDALEALRPPPGDAPTFRRYLAAERALLSAEDAVEHAASQGKAEGYARQLGLARCAQRHNVSS